jgi:hypothetical protein
MPKMHNVKLVGFYKSTYCKDLVTPMLGLLTEAYQDSDRFDANYYVFLSADSIPVKSFHTIYQETVLKKESAACISPEKAWFWTNGYTQAYVKHHQWLGLDFADASMAVALFNQSSGNVMDMVHLPDAMEAHRCLDEYWYLRLKLGPTNFKEHRQQVIEKLHAQSRCIMAVFWSDTIAKQYEVKFKDLLSHFIISVTIPGLHKLRDDPQYLFIRKVASADDNQHGYFKGGFWEYHKGAADVTVVDTKQWGGGSLPINIFIERTNFYDHHGNGHQQKRPSK